MILALVNEHGQQVSLLQDTWGVLTDPAHVIAELIISIIFELLQFIGVYWLWKKAIKPRLTRAVHAEVDAEHGITHHEDHTHPVELSQWTDDELIHGLKTGTLKFTDPTPEQQATFIDVLDKIEDFSKKEDAVWRRSQVPGDLGPL